MTAGAPDLSIIIVSWNVREFLRRCLSSVHRFTAGIDFEAFVVDNASTDGSAEMVRRDFPQAVLIANAENRGFAAANNQALVSARGRHIVLLNPDTELIDNALKALVDFLDGHPEAAACGPRLVYGDRTLQRSCRHFPTLFTELMETLFLDQAFPGNPVCGRYRMGGWRFDDTREVDQPYGACLMIRADVLRTVGFMDERFYMYYDEVDLCYRIRKAGWKIFFVHTATVVHHANKSSDQARLDCIRYIFRSKFLFFNKHYGSLSVAVLTAYTLLRMWLVRFPCALAHYVIGRPHDLTYFSYPLTLMWAENKAFLRTWKGY